LKIQKRLGEDRIVDSLKLFFFSNKNILTFKKGWEKIGLWISLNVLFFKSENLKIQKRLGEDCLICYQTNTKSKKEK